MKIYKCIICHIELQEKPIRLAKQLYGTGRYLQYNQVEHYDFCNKCFKKFENWINKHKEEKYEKTK